MATDIGTMIKRARERKRWTQRQLAAALGVDRKTVDNWENGRTKPARSIGALEAVLEVRLDGEDQLPAIPPELEGLPDLVARVRSTVAPDDQERVMAAIAATLAGRPQPPTGPGATEESPAEQREAG